MTPKQTADMDKIINRIHVGTGGTNEAFDWYFNHVIPAIGFTADHLVRNNKTALVHMHLNRMNDREFS